LSAIAMKLSVLTSRFYQLVAPDIPNEWDAEEVLEPYLDLSADLRRQIFRYIPVIWPISNSLCYDFLRVAPEALEALPLARLPHWVGEILDRYELDGLRAAQRFMRDVRGAYLQRDSGSGLILLHEVVGRLLPFIRGVAGRELRIASAGTVHTDGETIFLPAELAFFPTAADNILLYKLMLACQWAWLDGGSLTVAPPEAAGTDADPAVRLWLSGFFSGCPSPAFARDLYFQLEGLRATLFLGRELPGLLRAAARLPWPRETPAADDGPPACLLYSLRQRLWRPLSAAEPAPHHSSALADWHRRFAGDGVSARDSVEAVRRVCAELATELDGYRPMTPHPVLGEPCLAAVEALRRQRFSTEGEELVHSLALRLASFSREELEQLRRDEEEKAAGGSGAESDITMIMDSEFAGTVQEYQARAGRRRGRAGYADPRGAPVLR